MQSNKKLKIALVQSSASESHEENLKNTIEKVRWASKNRAQIVCLQELYKTIYFPQYEDKNFTHFAETIPGESTNAFSKLAKEYNIVIIVPIYEKDRGKYYNSAVVINKDGKLMDTYRKIHIPYEPYFYEKKYFEPGNKNYKPYKTKYAKFSVLICYDQWFPEAARICALKGADIIFYPTAIGYIKDYKTPGEDWQNAWETIQRAHSIANGIHIAAVNRVGEEGQLKFFGSSFVCDSFGNILKKASSEKEEILIVELDLSKNRQIQESWGFLRNRVPDTYSDLVK